VLPQTPAGMAHAFRLGGCADVLARAAGETWVGTDLLAVREGTPGASPAAGALR
jgi:hypothetical protein